MKNIEDVENESKSKSQPKPKRRNPTVRLAFHALIPNTDPSQPDLPLMVASNPISCSQPEGQPEILRMSSLLGNPEGGDEVFIIGKLYIGIRKRKTERSGKARTRLTNIFGPMGLERNEFLKILGFICVCLVINLRF